jgi:hypothetical protein
MGVAQLRRMISPTPPSPLTIYDLRLANMRSTTQFLRRFILFLLILNCLYPVLVLGQDETSPAPDPAPDPTTREQSPTRGPEPTTQEPEPTTRENPATTRPEPTEVRIPAYTFHIN